MRSALGHAVNQNIRSFIFINDYINTKHQLAAECIRTPPSSLRRQLLLDLVEALPAGLRDLSVDVQRPEAGDGPKKAVHPRQADGLDRQHEGLAQRHVADPVADKGGGDRTACSNIR